MNEKVFAALNDVNNIKIMSYRDGQCIVDDTNTVLSRLKRTDEYFDEDFYLILKIHELKRLVGLFPDISRELGLPFLWRNLMRKYNEVQQTDLQTDQLAEEADLPINMEDLEQLEVPASLLELDVFRESAGMMCSLFDAELVNGFIKHWKKVVKKQRSFVIGKLDFKKSLTGILELAGHDPSSIIEAKHSIHEIIPHTTTFNSKTPNMHSTIHTFSKKSTKLNDAVKAGFKMGLYWNPKDQASVVERGTKTLSGVVFTGYLPRGTYAQNYLTTRDSLEESEGYHLIQKAVSHMQSMVNSSASRSKESEVKVKLTVCDLHTLGTNLQKIADRESRFDVQTMDGCVALMVNENYPFRRATCDPIVTIIRQELCAAYYSNAFFRGCLAYFMEKFCGAR